MKTIIDTLYDVAHPPHELLAVTVCSHGIQLYGWLMLSWEEWERGNR